MRPINQPAGFLEQIISPHEELNNLRRIGYDLEVKNDQSRLEWPSNEHLNAAPFQTVCHFFASGNCTKGEDCPFQHVAPSCDFYQLWKGTKGSDCSFSHISQEAVGGSPRSQVTLFPAETPYQNMIIKKGQSLNSHSSSLRNLPKAVVPQTPREQPDYQYFSNSRLATGFPDSSQVTPNSAHSVLQTTTFSPQVCHFFANGVCSKGDSCSFAHYPANIIPIAADSASQIPPVRCHLFDKGWCTKGDDCSCAHISEPQVAISRTLESSQPIKVCHFFVNGQCTRGNRCTYNHDSQVLSSSDPNASTSTSMTRSTIPCHFFFSGKCLMGKSCQFAHKTNGNQTLSLSQNSSQDIALNSLPCRFFKRGFCSKGNSCSFTHAGCDISSDLTPSKKMVQVRRHVFGTQVAIFGPGVSVVSVLPSIRNKRKRPGEIRSRALKVQWYPTLIAYLNFDRYSHAQKIATDYNGAILRGRAIKCSARKVRLYMSQKKPAAPGIVSVSNIQPGVSKADLRSLIDHPTCNMEPVPVDQDDAPTAIKSALEKHGTLDSFDLQHVAIGSFKRGAIAKFATADGASRAVNYLRVHPTVALERLKLTLTALYSAKFSVLYDLYNIKKKEVKDAFQACRPHVEELAGISNSGVTCELLGAEASSLRSKVTILLHSADAHDLARAKGNFELVLEGSHVTDTADDETVAAWSDVFGKPRGTKVLRELGKETGSFVYRDVRKKELRVHGSTAACAAAIKKIRSYLTDLKAKQHVIPISPTLIRRMIHPGSLEKQLMDAGSRSVILQLKPPSLVVEAGTEALAEIEASLERIQVEDLVQTNDEDAIEVSCPICFHDVGSQKLELDCGHIYCKDCFTALATHALPRGVPMHFPLECIKEDCNQRISLHALESVLSTDQQRALHETALEYHVNSHPEQYQWCITPDCRGVYAVSSSIIDRVALCGSCDVEICTSCRVEEHWGIDCEEYARLKYGDLLTQGQTSRRRHRT